MFFSKAQQTTLSPTPEWHEQLVGIDIDTTGPSSALFSLLFSQPPISRSGGHTAGAISVAASLRPPSALLHSACVLLHSILPRHCQSPCSPSALQQASIVSPSVILRNGSLGDWRSAQQLQQPWVSGSLLHSPPDTPSLVWGLGQLPHSLLAGRSLALAMLHTPLSCTPAEPAAPATGPPWGSAFQNGTALHLSITRHSSTPSTTLLTWRTSAAAAAAASAPASLTLAFQGTGFARTLLLTPPQPTSQLTALLHIPPTAFVDLDELRSALLAAQPHSPPPTATAFTPYLEIELPAAASTHHTLLLHWPPSAAAAAHTLAIPYHLRHAAPGCSAAQLLQEAPAGSPFLAAAQAAPLRVYSDGSAYFAGSGSSSAFPRRSGCFRASLAPVVSVVVGGGGNGTSSSSSSSSSSIVLSAAPPFLVPVAMLDDRVHVDSSAALTLLLLCPALVLLLVLLLRRGGSGAKAD